MPGDAQPLQWTKPCGILDDIERPISNPGGLLWVRTKPIVSAARLIRPKIGPLVYLHLVLLIKRLGRSLPLPSHLGCQIRCAISRRRRRKHTPTSRQA